MSDIISHMSSIPEENWNRINWKDSADIEVKDIVTMKVTATVINGRCEEVDIQEC